MVRTDLHRAALGVPAARDRARALAATIDNPALTRMADRKAKADLQRRRR